jgi:homoserine O-succinyltransferase
MPLNIPNNLPAIEELTKENIFVLREERAIRQDIRPLQIAILNLMPIKRETETHILRLLSNSPLQIEIVLLRTKSYEPKNTPKEHLEAFYKTFDEIKNQKFDGMIITGAPLEKFDFDKVDYWQELTEIMEWANEQVTSTMYICWAAQAGLYHHYKIPKLVVEKKIFGVFEHRVLNSRVPIVRGFDEVFLAPHSRYSTVAKEDINKIDQLEILTESDDAGVHMVTEHSGKHIFITGHSEYDPMTLKNEYMRDINKGLPIHLPYNYFQHDDPSKPPLVRWKGHAHLMFSNWLNYYVYQMTSFDQAYKQIIDNL